MLRYWKTVADRTNCIVMPNHGVTTFGRDLSEAYHRLTSVIAEVQRIIQALQIATMTGKEVNWIPEQEVRQMFENSEQVVYGVMRN